MRSLHRAAKYAEARGEEIPMPIKGIADLGVRMRRGQLSLLVSAPGGGKTLLALNIALKAGIPCLYVSADTDRADQSERAAALLSGTPAWQLTEQQHNEAIAQIPQNVRFDFDSSPTPSDLMQMCEAYGVVFGEYPHLIIVDTLAKIWTEAGEEHSRNKEAVDRCQELARITGAHVLVAHHATKGYDSGNQPIALDGLMSGVSKIPELVLTMWRDQGDRITVASVKNRSGPADATATGVRTFLDVDYERMTVTDTKQAVFNWQDDPELM